MIVAINRTHSCAAIGSLPNAPLPLPRMLLWPGNRAASTQGIRAGVFALSHCDGTSATGQASASVRAADGWLHIDRFLHPGSAHPDTATTAACGSDHGLTGDGCYTKASDSLTMDDLNNQKRKQRLERRFENAIWKFRLITLVPVVMSLIGSVSCFVIGTFDEITVLQKVIQGRFSHGSETLIIGKVVGGIDFYLIGIALLIFGYGIYELIISDIDVRQQDNSQERRNLLNIDSLDSLKHKLTKVIIVALIVTAFKVMVSFEVNTITELLQYCAGVLMLSFSAYLIGRTGKH